MNRKQVIETLKMENELICFNPLTGEDIPLECINDLNKNCYDAHQEAIRLINNSIPIEWIERWLNNIANDERYKNEYVELTEEVKRIVYRQTLIIKIPCISDMLEDWKKENEINRRG